MTRIGSQEKAAQNSKIECSNRVLEHVSKPGWSLHQKICEVYQSGIFPECRLCKLSRWYRLCSNASGNPVTVATRDGVEAKNIDGIAVWVHRAQDEFNIIIDYIVSSSNISSKDFGDNDGDDGSSFKVNKQMKLNSPGVEEKVDVYWPFDKIFYPSVTESISDTGKQLIQYDDGEH